MKRILSIVIGFVLVFWFGQVMAEQNTLYTAQESEIQAIILEKTVALALAEKHIEYITGRAKQDHTIRVNEFSGVFEDTVLINETISSDIESLLEHAKVFLGMEYYSIPAERWALDSGRVNRARNTYDALSGSYKLWQNTIASTQEEHEKLLEDMTSTTKVAIALSNRILKVIEKSIEQSATDENPTPISLADARSAYREFRTMMMENLDAISELTDTLEALDNESQSTHKYDTEILAAKLEKASAYTALKKAERLLIQIKNNGNVDLENL